MGNGILEQLRFLRQVQVLKYLHFNHFCPRVIRQGTGRLIPYRGAVLDLAPGSQIILGNADVELGCNALRGSRSETWVRLRENACWDAPSGCQLSYGAALEVLQDGKLDTGFFTMNSGSTLIAAKHITLGEDVMIARNATIFDSDFHPLMDEQGNVVNPAARVRIAGHVWIGAGATILKGVSIGQGSIVAAGAVCTKSCGEEHVVLGGNPAAILRRNINWSR